MDNNNNNQQRKQAPTRNSPRKRRHSVRILEQSHLDQNGKPNPKVVRLLNLKEPGCPDDDDE